MKAGTLIDVMAAIVTVGLVTTVVTSKNSAGIIGSAGNAFANSLRAAMGK